MGGGILLPFLSGLFLLFEFRDTRTSAMFNFHIVRWWIVFIIFVSYRLFIEVKDKKKIFPAFCIFISSIGWQLWIHIFIYGLGNFREITWGFLLLWFVWVLYDTYDDVKSLATSFIWVVLFFSIFALPKIMITDIIRLYSGARDAAYAIETLPEDAAIFESKEDFCNAVIPYLKTQKIYNPFSRSEATYITRNPKLKHSMTYDEFVSVCNSMFPDKKDVWVLYHNGNSISTGYIYELKAHLNSEDLYYSDEDKKIINNEHFSIYHLELE